METCHIHHWENYTVLNTSVNMYVVKCYNKKCCAVSHLDTNTHVTFLLFPRGKTQSTVITHMYSHVCFFLLQTKHSTCN